MPKYRQRVGKHGEDLAAEYLQKHHKYEIIDRNFRIQGGEIDLIALNRDKNKDVLVFVEVRSRKTKGYGKPEESISDHKKASIKRTAQFYKLQNPDTPNLMRIDVVCIDYAESPVTPEITLFKDAFS